MTPGLFFTGTDTGVGKTWVMAAVARTLRKQGKRVRVCKPIATGGTQQGNRWISEDTRLLAQAVGEHDLARITPWCFEEPAAPPVAAHAAGVDWKLEPILHFVRGLRHPETALLVEGVGGLLCPLSDTETVADLIARLDMSVVVVARRSLGTLNHTLMTLESAERRRLRIVGVVVSETEPPSSLAERTNVDELRKRIKVPILGVLPHGAAELPSTDWWRWAGSTC